MRRVPSLVLLAASALLLTPGAASAPVVPGDETPPVVTPVIVGTLGLSGWYVTNVTVSWSITDPESIILSTSGCDTTTLTADTLGTTLTCSATSDGGTTTVSKTFKIDKTAPALVADPVPDPNPLGWHKAALTVKFPGTDATSGINACTPDQAYFGPDTTNTPITGSCTDKAGNTSGPKTYTVKYDATVPALTPDPEPNPNANGWHRAALQVKFPGTDVTSGINACTPDQPYTGPDTPGHNITGTCSDKAGNTTSPKTYTVKYDSTPPTAAPSAAPQPNPLGWHKAPLTVTFVGSDALSGPDQPSCTIQGYSGPDTQGHTITGTCKDLAGNTSNPSTYTVKYDATVPALTPAPDRGPDVNGWYNHQLTIGFPGTDATSGIDACTPPQNYSGPDSANATKSGSCTDQAGNSTAKTFTFKYDATAPSLVPDPDPNPNPLGWHRQPLVVKFPGTDATSGINACSSDFPYSGPDTTNAPVTGSCTDKAGNTTGPKTYTIKFDITAPTLVPEPSRQPDGNGWYNHQLSIGFPGIDVTSQIDTCTPPQSYSGPDTTNASKSGTCTDKAGNSTAKTFTFKYDGTKPQVTEKIPSRPPNADGWYKEPLSVEYKGSDNLSAVDSCAHPSYSGPESATASVTGTCLDKAGNESQPSSFGFKYDSTGPAVIPTPTRGPDANGWYNHAVSVSFGGSDGASGLASCAGPQSYQGPDTVFAVVSGTCTDKAGNVGLGSLALKYDATAPKVDGASADRAPDGNGWYNHPLTVRFFGSDATSGIDACTAAGYAGPNNPSASVTGACSDRAGNPSGASPFALKYDATAPSLTKLTVKAGNRSAVLSWEASPDTNLVEISRKAGANTAGVTVYRGTGRTFTDSGLQNGVRYRYTLTGYDEARNAAAGDLAATPTAPLLSPKAGATVSAPPRLAWRPAPKATYYNVQVWRRGRIFSAWPTRTALQLPRTWTYNGRRHRLSPGRYRWYVWPGYGRRSQKDFGRLIGSSSFVVTR